jgi:hypothetical protein
VDVSITAFENLVLEVPQLLTLVGGQRGLLGGIEVAPREPALPSQGAYFAEWAVRSH